MTRISLCILFVTMSVSAQITVDKKTVKVSAFTDGKSPATVTAQVNVTSTAKVEGLIVEAESLTGPGGVVVDRSNIKLAAATVSIDAGATVPVIVSIGGLPKPGKYTGSIILRTAKPGASETVNLEIDLMSKPSVTLGTDGLAVYTCKIAWFCKAAELWTPAKRNIAITNQSAGPVTIQDPKIFLRAVRGSDALDEIELKPSLPAQPMAGTGGVIRLEIPPDLPADRYQGTLRVSVLHGDDALATPVTLDVKHAPWIALLVLAIGIALGRMVQSLNTPVALAQQRLFALHSVLRALETGVHDFAVAQLLNRMLDDTRAAIETMIKSEMEISQELTRISTAIDLAKSIERLRTQAETLVDPGPALQDLNAARTALLGEDFATAEKERREAQQKILQATDPAFKTLKRTIQPPRGSRPTLRPMTAFCASSNGWPDPSPAAPK